MAIELRALAAGVLAGLAIAVPLGAIGVLILQEGVLRGRRSAISAATGVALVDLSYATVATVAGGQVTRLLIGRTRTVQLVGAVVLVVVAVRGLVGLRRSAGIATRPGAATPPGAPPTATNPTATTANLAADGVGARPMVTIRPARVLRRFVALTAINPLTAIYFVVLAAGLGATVAGWRAGSAFVLGVFVGSLAWQLLLALAGTLAGARLPAWARTATGCVGYLMVTGYAVRLALG
jgi:arginine exporter protein ArgO